MMIAYRIPRPIAHLLLALIVVGAVAACAPLLPLSTVRSSADELLVLEDKTVHLVDEGGGRAAGSPIVLLHGFGASTYSWRAVVPRLADGHRVLALDLHGFGLGERPEELDAYTAEGQIGLVLGVLDRLGIERVHLVGHSYGGALAAVLAARYPERVRSLTLVSAAAPRYLTTRRRPVVASEPVAPLVVRGLMLHRARVREKLEDSVADPSIVSPEMVDAYYDRLRVEGAVRAYRGLTRPLDRPEPDVDLARLTLPVLLVWGDRDPLIPVAVARRATRALPDARFVTLPAVGHLPMEEAPEQLAEEIDRFVGAVESAADDELPIRRAAERREARGTGQ